MSGEKFASRLIVMPLRFELLRSELNQTTTGFHPRAAKNTTRTRNHRSVRWPSSAHHAPGPGPCTLTLRPAQFEPVATVKI